MSKQRMTPQFAVFNLHVNDAGKKADREIIKQYGKEEFDTSLKPLHKFGIMAIFDQSPPTPIRVAWIALCTYFVNETVK